jgi:hypothetical protein
MEEQDSSEVNMDPLSIEIYDEKAIEFVKTQSVVTKTTPTGYVVDLIKRTMISQDASLKDITSINDVVDNLKAAYYSEYKKRFGLDAPHENGDGTQAILEVVAPMIEVKAADKVQAMLMKAITWYLNFHENTDPNGQSFPYGIKYLFAKKNPWLLRSCIESSGKMDSNLFNLMQKGLTRDEALRIMKRGDAVGSGKQSSSILLLQEAQLLYNDVLKQIPVKQARQVFKFHKKVDLLFKAETPSEEYIKDSIEFIKNVKTMVENANI